MSSVVTPTNSILVQCLLTGKKSAQGLLFVLLQCSNIKWALGDGVRGGDDKAQKRWLWCPLVSKSQSCHLPRNSSAGGGGACICGTHSAASRLAPLHTH